LKKSTLHICIIRFICIMLTAGICAAVPAAAQIQKVAVIPFAVYAEKDLTFLQKGIVDMLTSRLSRPGEVAVLGREVTEEALKDVQGPLNPEKAAGIGQELGADHVLYGSLTVFGESVSVDAKMIDVSGGREPLSFFTQSSSFGEVIPAVDRFAAEINEKAFGRKEATFTAPAPAPAAPEPGPSAERPDVYAHPDTLIQGGFGETGERRTASEEGFDMGRAWKSRSFSKSIVSMDLGDVDQDGKIETVLATPDQILVYRFENERFLEKARIEMPRFRFVVGVDVGDINGNGVEEIFVSALNGQRNGLQSMVYEYANGSYTPIVESSPWYFRVVRKRHFGKQLYGQQQILDKTQFDSPIYRMAWEGGDYVSQHQVLPAKKANVLGFSMGRPVEAGDEMAVAYSRQDLLQILEPGGVEVWTGAELFGGSTLYLLLPVDDPGMVEKKGFFPMRIRVRDLNGDGTEEIIVAQNHELSNRRLEARRIYNETQLHCLSWDGLGLASVWKTRTLSGHIRDLGIADFDGDGVEELVAVLVMKEGKIIGTDAKCSVIAFDIIEKAAQ